MSALYITSLERGAGKTGICAGMGQYLLESGRKAGYLKPLAAKGIDQDAAFMKQILALVASDDILNPSPDSVKKAYDQVSQVSDVVMVEGNTVADKDAAGIVDTLDAGVIIVAGYSADLLVAEIIDSGKEFGQRFLGVVVNKVPEKKLGQVGERLSADGVKVLGVLPEVRALYGLTVGELAGQLEAEMLNAPEKPVELVENIMLGALSVDSGLPYFKRKTNKAAVIRGGRSDLQLAALETPTRCLVLTGDTAPSEIVLHRAEEKAVPVIVAKADTNDTVAAIEAALVQSQFHQEKKVPVIAGIIKRHLDLEALF